MLADFIESSNQEKDKLVRMGTIKSTKEQYLSTGLSNQAKGKKKYLKQNEKEKKQSSSESSSSTDGSSRSRRRNKRERPKCGYFRSSNIEIYLFINNMDIMNKIIEENHIDLPYFARGWERKQGSGKP